MDASPSTLDTSSEAFRSVGLKKLARQQQEIYDIVKIAHEMGRINCSLTEIRDLYESTYLKRIDLNRVSARVSDLVSAQRLARTLDTRPCSITKKNIHPVFVPLKQARMFV